MRRIGKMLYSYAESVKLFEGKYNLKKAVQDGKIYQIEKGIYSDQKYTPENVIIAAKYPKAVFTMNSAFYYYNLTDVIPEKYYLSTDRNASKIADKRVVQIFENSYLVMLGMTMMKFNGGTINIYNRERLLVELLRHRNKLSFDYYKEIILSYREIIHELDIRLIQDYAYEVPKSSKILETLQLEVL